MSVFLFDRKVLEFPIATHDVRYITTNKVSYMCFAQKSVEDTLFFDKKQRKCSSQPDAMNSSEIQQLQLIMNTYKKRTNCAYAKGDFYYGL